MSRLGVGLIYTLMCLVFPFLLVSCNHDEDEIESKMYVVEISNSTWESITLSIDTVPTVTRCEVECVELGITKKVSLSAPKTIVFSDLSENTTYNFNIKYYNSTNINVYTKKIIVRTAQTPQDLPRVSMTLAKASVAYLQVAFKMEGKAVKFSCNQGSTLTSSYKYTKDRELTFGELLPLTEYTITARAYDEEGNAGPLIRTKFKTIACPYTNYLIYNSEVYRLTSAEMQASHGYSGTNTGSNFKYLRFYGDDAYLQFSWANHEWEGIDKKWSPGTYTISTDSHSYYTYSAYGEIDGRKVYPDGKLKITQDGSKMAFDFTLEDAWKIVGHYEGTVQ